jgi:hypothetical protein
VFFVKQLGTLATANGVRLQLLDRHGGDRSAWPGDLRVREMPITASVVDQ